MNEFLAGASRCDEVGGDVKAEGQGSSISVQFGGNQIDVQIAEGVCDELTGHPIAHDQVVEGIRTEMVQLETLEVTPILRRRVAPSQLNMKFKSSQRGGFYPKDCCPLSCLVGRSPLRLWCGKRFSVWHLCPHK